MKYLIISLLLFQQTLLANEKQSTTRTSQKGFIYGAGVAHQQQIYKGFDQRTIAIPVLGYIGEKLNVFGPFINYSLYRNTNWQMGINLAPRFNGFDESDSDFFQGMGDRHDSFDAGLNIKYTPQQWVYEFKTLSDVLSNSNGSEFAFTISHKNRFSNGVMIEPRVALNYFDDDLSDYYYGVRALEATKSRAAYQASSTLNKTLGLSVNKALPIGLLQLDINHTWYGSEISDSPLVDSDSAFGMRLFFIRYF